jgi:hypothetical protein
MSSLKFMFHIFLLGSLLISIYFFIETIILKNNKYSDLFSTWQFPMLLALYLDTIYR